jgi:hypothetical protein
VSVYIAPSPRYSYRWTTEVGIPPITSTTQSHQIIQGIAIGTMSGFLITAVDRDAQKKYLFEYSKTNMLKAFSANLTLAGVGGTLVGYLERLGGKDWDSLSEKDKAILRQIIAGKNDPRLNSSVGNFYNALKKVYFALKSNDLNGYVAALDQLRKVLGSEHQNLYFSDRWNLFRMIYDSATKLTFAAQTNEYIYRLNKDIYKKVKVGDKYTVAIAWTTFLDVVRREWEAGNLTLVYDNGNPVLVPTIEGITVNHYRFGGKFDWAKTSSKSSLNLTFTIGMDFANSNKEIHSKGSLFYKAQAGYVWKVGKGLFVSVNAGFRSEPLEEIVYDESRGDFIVKSGREKVMWLNPEIVWVVNPKLEVRLGTSFQTITQPTGKTKYRGVYAQVGWQITKNLRVVGEWGSGTYEISNLGKFKGWSSGGGVEFTGKNVTIGLYRTFFGGGPAYGRSYLLIRSNSKGEITVKE